MPIAAVLATASAAAPDVLAAQTETGCRTAKPIRIAAREWNARRVEMRHLTRWQRYRNSVRWRMTSKGVITCRGAIRLKKREMYRIKMVPEAWKRYGPLIRAAARKYRVPAELFVAIIVNESGLKPKSYQKYSGYISDRKTPERISVGLGAVLISTARYMLKDNTVDRKWLQDPENAIRMIGVYLDLQYRKTGFDPARVAAAYNAGAVYHENGATNRWKMRNYPVGSAIYIDHFVAVLGATMQFLSNRPDRPPESYAAMFAGEPQVHVKVRIPKSWYRRPSEGGRTMMMLTENQLLIGDSPAEARRERSFFSRFGGKKRASRAPTLATRTLQKLLD